MSSYLPFSTKSRAIAALLQQAKIAQMASQPPPVAADNAPTPQILPNVDPATGAMGPAAPNPAFDPTKAQGIPAPMQGQPPQAPGPMQGPPMPPKLPPPPYMGAGNNQPPGYLNNTQADTPPDDASQDATPAYGTDPASNAARQAGGTDNQAPADDNRGLFSATGKTDSFGSWFNKRNSSDALTAFGAAMLKAPNFLQGLGDAALAVNSVDRQNRMPTKEEIARANILDKTQNGSRHGGGFAAKPIAAGFAADHTYWQGNFDQNGKQVWTQEGTGNTQAFPPSGFVPSSQSGVGQRTKDNEKYLTTARDKADQAQQNFSKYDQILETAPKAGVGSDGMDKMFRSLASITGMDLGDVNLEDTQVFNKNTRNLELNLAQGQKGLGQFTEMERQIVREALPSLDTKASTVFRITTQMKLRDQLDTELYNDYMDMPASRRPSFEDYAYDKRREQAKTYEQRYKALVGQELGDHPEYKKLGVGDSKSSDTPAQAGKTSTGVPWKVVE